MEFNFGLFLFIALPLCSTFMSENSNPNVSQSRPLRNRVHEVIFGAHTRVGLLFDLFLLLAIVLSVITISLETVKGEEGIGETWAVQLRYAKWVFTILFTVEYLLRIYCVKRPLKYIFSFWGIIDLLAILPDYILLLPIFSGISSNGFSVVRSLRLLRVFRIMNLSWFQYEAEELGGAIWRSRAKIIVFLMVVMIIVTVAGTVLYEVEHIFAPLDEFGNSTAQIENIPHGIYWAIVTMTTVGFGDVVPVTTGGMFISAILILVGYSLIIVPTGFVSAEVIGSKRNPMSTISCTSCLSGGHDMDSVYCKFCGEKL